MAQANSFEEIYKIHVSMVYNLCLNYLQQAEDAEEVTQDVFVKIHQKLNEFNEQSSLKTWIYRISLNQCHDFVKAKKRQKRFGIILSIFDNEKGEMPIEPNFNHPGVQMEDKEAIAAIFKVINKLPENQKTAIILKTIDGLKQQEIADVMHTSVKAVESLLSRAKKNLKQNLKQNEGKGN